MSDRSGLGFGQIDFAYKTVIDLDILSASTIFIVAALMDDDFLYKLPQKGRGQFLKAGVFADNLHKPFRIYGGFLHLGKLC